jgi:hypothetical protein
MKQPLSLQQVLEFTRKYFPTRFDYKRRDVLRRVVVKERKEINVKDPSRPQHYFQIETFSYPQYGNYLRMTGRKGRQRQYQRTVRHQYDSVLTLQELSLQTTVWKYRLGSQKKWEEHPPQKHIKQMYRDTQRKFRRKAERKAGPNATKKEISREYKKLVDRHKRGARYLDVGDYNAQRNGINGDWYWRAAWSYYVHGHLYGPTSSERETDSQGNIKFVKKPSPVTNPQEIAFAPKHMIALIDYLLQKGDIHP